MSNVSGVIKSIQDIMRKDVGVDGDAQRISQLVWMFFLKIFDDREAELELVEDDYKSPLPKHLRWRAWAKDPEGMTGDELADFVNVQLFPYLKEKLPTSGAQGKRAQVVRGVFEDAYNYMKSGTLMRQVVNKICEIDFNNSGDRHTFGSIYEQILRDLQSAGNAGEFYTPRAVTRFIVDRVDPKLEESVLDPACGTGGFLTCTIDHKRERYAKTKEDDEILASSIRGFEKKALPHMLAVTNMILHGIDTPTNIRHSNTLSRAYTSYGNADRVNVIVTNPPFGGMEEDGIENNFPANLRTRETADLFMALIIRLLKNKGRAAVVLPDGFLFGEGMKTRLKQSLLEECNLHTVVRLPNGVFSPYTGIKTNLLFFTKGTPTKDVWYYEHPYPDAIKSYNKTKPMRFEEFEAEMKWWGNEADGFATRERTQQAWKVPVTDIVARNYNLDIKNPHVGQQVSHDPEELLHQWRRLNDEAGVLCTQLKDVLKEAICGEGRARVAEVFTNSLEIWASGQSSKSTSGRGSNGSQEFYGIKKLRELILGLAVRGRLVRPGGKWKSVNIGGLGKWAIGGGFPTSEQGKSDLEILFAKVSDMNLPENGRFIVTTINTISRETASQLRINIHPAGTVIFPKIGGAIATNKRRILSRPTAIDNNCLGITPNDGVSTEWLHLLLTSIDFSQYQAGTSVPALAQGVLAEIPVLLPTLDEQSHIVMRVGQLMTLCDAFQTNLSHVQEIQVQLADAAVEQAFV